MLVVTVTGHRPNKLGGYGENPTKTKVIEWLRSQLLGIQEKIGPINLGVSGMAIGVDQWFAENCHSLGIPFEAAIPFFGQETAWPISSQERYHKLLELASVKTVVSPGGYSAAKMQIRNQYMVDKCHILLAVWDGTSGGTANCVAYALKQGKKPIIIPREILL